MFTVRSIILQIIWVIIATISIMFSLDRGFYVMYLIVVGIMSCGIKTGRKIFYHGQIIQERFFHISTLPWLFGIILYLGLRQTFFSHE